MSASSASQPLQGLPRPRRDWAQLTVALAIIMAVLDGTIVNVALPAIARDLQVSAAESVWVVNAYQLMIMVSLLPLAALGDILGYRRIYLGGLGLFVLASFICATTDHLGTLTAARALQGLGAAGIMSINTALVRFIWPAHKLGRGIGINAMVVAVSAAVGPTVAAGILALGDWPWLFAINVPVGLLALAIGLRALPHTPRSPHPFDYPAAVLNVLAFGLLIIGIDTIAHGGAWGQVGLELGLALVFGALLVRRELSQPAPLLPVDLLQIPLFALSVSTSVCAFTGQMMAFVAVPFYLQDVLGRSQVETGLLMTPWPLTLAVLAPIAGRLADRYPAGGLGGLGMLLFAAGLALLGLLPPAPDAFDIGWRMALCGLGFGLFQTPNNRTIIGSAPPVRSGGASGMLGSARLLGQTLGAALTALIFGWLVDGGTEAALFTAAGFALVAALISSLRLAAPPAPH